MQVSCVSRAIAPALALCLSAPVGANWYAGLGSGSAVLDTQTTPPTEVFGTDHPTRPTDRFPWNAVIGWAGEPFSIEAFHARFSEVELGPTGQLSRDVTGFMGRKSLYRSGCTAGLAYDVSAALGVARVQSDYTDVEANPTASSALVAALGASVMLGSGVSVRAQYDHFDSDTRLFSATLIKGFGAPSHCGDASVSGAVASGAVASGAVASDAQPATPPIEQLTNVLFNRDSSFLTDQARAQLDALAERMRAYPGLVLEVQGHSDNAEWGGADLALSAERARRVARALVQRGVESERLALSGYAASRPVADENQAALNRRVQFRILALR